MSALVSCSLRKPSTRAQRATYGDGAYCACSATSARTALTTGSRTEEQLPQQQRPVQLAQRPRNDGGLQQIGRRIGEERRQLVEQHAVRDQPLPRIGAAREEAERRPHRRGRVVERAAQRQLVVVQAVRIDRRPRVAGQPAEEDDRSARAGRARPRRARPARCPPPRSRRPPRARRPSRRRTRAASSCRSARPPTTTGRPPASATHAQSISPIGPAPRIATVSPASTSARSTPRRQHASGSTSAATSDARPGGTSSRLTAAIRSGTTSQSAYAPERNSSARHCSPRAQPSHAPHGAEFAATTRRPSDEPAELVPERRRQRAQQHRVPAPIGLQIGAVGERDLDLHQHLPRPGLGLRHVLDAQVARARGAAPPSWV